MLVLILLIIAASLLYYYAIKPYSYWKKRNVPTGKIIPIFGDNFHLVMGTESVLDMVQRLYNKVADSRYIGIYQFAKPVLLLKSPEIIKHVCVKDFDHFLDHVGFVPEGIDELWSKNLISLKGQTWKNMRATLSPSFTSSKMKSMFLLICRNANLFTQYFLKKDEKIIQVDFKDAYTRYTNDVIASTAFGLEIDSLSDRKNEFYVLGRESCNFNSLSKKLIFFLYQTAPKIATILGISLFGRKVKSFFINLVHDTIKMREERNIKRPDMLGLLIEARKGQQTNETIVKPGEENSEDKNIKQDLSDVGIASQVFIFFLGGFETVSTAMCFLAYELAVNYDVQKRLIEEIDETRSGNEEPSYETIMKMPYLEMVVSELLRKWPVNIATDRLVTKPYTIEPELPNEKTVTLEVGDNIIIPIAAIHRDPKIYEDPDKFDPERFSEENRKNIDSYHYIPFGVGPRNCIGSRFALLEMKAVFFYLLSNFEIVPTERTQIPLRISKSALALAPEDGFHLGLKRRE